MVSCYLTDLTFPPPRRVARCGEVSDGSVAAGSGGAGDLTSFSSAFSTSFVVF